MPAELRLGRTRVYEELLASIERGRNLLDMPRSTEAENLALLDAYRSWDFYNRRLLDQAFTPVPWPSDGPKSQYVTINDIRFLSGDAVDSNHLSILVRTIEDKVKRLSSIRDTLDLYAETSDVLAMSLPGSLEGVATPQAIFLVHGRNDAARLEVQRFLERVTKLDVTVLADRPSQGQTIIEKLEGHFENSAFAVVLMTADDEGRLRDAGTLQYRARQNVVLELGMAVAKLGRRNVAVLYEDGVEMPSDYYGVIFTPFDSGGGWKLRLVGELKSAGIDADANAIFS